MPIGSIELVESILVTKPREPIESTESAHGVERGSTESIKSMDSIKSTQ